jgi:hypothetical protein
MKTFYLTAMIGVFLLLDINEVKAQRIASRIFNECAESRIRQRRPDKHAKCRFC